MPKVPPIHRQPTAKAIKHNPRGKAAADRQRTRAMNTNSKAWKQIRQFVLTRDAFTCAVCGKYGDQVDHIDGDSHNNPRDGSNWQTLCHSDHSAKTMRELNKARR